jgi:hypothetical protein
MNKVYEAIIALDRSMRDFLALGWMQGDFGTPNEPKCAIGGLSHSLIGETCDVSEMWFSLVYPMETMVSRVGLMALWEALTDEQRDALETHCVHLADNPHSRAVHSFKVASGGNASTQDYATMVFIANDNVMQSDEEVIRWFSDAIDVLARDLPVPPGPLFPAARQNSVELALA